MTTESQAAVLAPLAEEILEAFAGISAAARARLEQKPGGPRLDSLANPNAMTSDKARQNLATIQRGTELDCRTLMGEPAVVRLVVEVAQGQRETIYITRAGTVDPVPVKMCSYLTPKGRLAEFAVGDVVPVRLPSGEVEFEIIEKAILRPAEVAAGWDARPATLFADDGIPLSIRSLRDLLADASPAIDPGDILAAILASDDGGNIVRGLRHETINAMEMRVSATLDRFQGEVFRLPIDTRLVLLGPPGTGKTTTLIRRLRQKVDQVFLTEDELAIVSGTGQDGLHHANSWLMFTPTALLKAYLKEAFAKEGVPAPDERITTWSEHRRQISRGPLRILRTGNSSGFTLREEMDALQPATISRQIEWFEDFATSQNTDFLASIATEVERLSSAGDPNHGRLGRALAATLASVVDRPLPVLSEIARLDDDLRVAREALREETAKALDGPIATHLARDRDMLGRLALFLPSLSAESDGDEDDDDDEEEAAPRVGARAAHAALVRALRAQALAEALKRPLPLSGRAARILGWAREQGISIPPLAGLGERLLLQRALTRLLAAPDGFLRLIPRRYRAFRRTRIADGRWYVSAKVAADSIGPLELDMIVLATLRAGMSMAGDGTLMRRLGERQPALLGEIIRCQRNQIMVDEATDFSPIQLAAMAALANPRTSSFFACGDFNQRLTVWGSRSEGDLQWLFPDIEVRRVAIGYRQTRLLSNFGAALTGEGNGAHTSAPEHFDNEGVAPVLALNLDSFEKIATWLAARIAEIEGQLGMLPSIAVLVNDRDALDPLADALTLALAAVNVEAKACHDGMAIGSQNDVRVFEVEHIKGLQFEAVFFVDIDRLAEAVPDLFGKFLYVGATRAATYLGLTCAGPTLPASMEHISSQMAECW